MSFERVLKLIKRPPVQAGLARMAPAVRRLAEELLERFSDKRADAMTMPHEGAALALWGTEKPDAFLEWHRARGGLAAALEVLLASAAFDRRTYEWDSSVWALVRARPADGLRNLGTTPWLWLRRELDKAKPAEREAALEVANRASKAWHVRAALAFAFPDDKARWTDADRRELRQTDVDLPGAIDFGVLAAMRHAKLDHAKIEKMWRIGEAIPPKAIIAELGKDAVAPLRLIGAFEALASHGEPDGLRVLMEFCDRATEVVAKIEPTKHAIAALAPLFTTQRPRRVLAHHLARGFFAELVTASPADAEKAAKGADAAFITSVIAETGAKLPADDTWTSPWTAKPSTAKKEPAAPARVAKPAKPVALSFAEKIHWQKREREQIAGQGGQGRRKPKDDVEHAKTCRREAKGDKAFMLYLAWMNDKPALALWKEIEPKRWYGHADDLEQLLARFGLDELDSLLAFVQVKPDALAALSRVESPRVAAAMARGFAVIKKSHDVGKAWLEKFPEAAAVGLVRDPGAGVDKKQRDANIKALAHVASKHPKIVETVLAKAGVATDTKQLAKAAGPKLPPRAPKLPDFVEVERLPRPIRNDGKAALQGDALAEFAQLLKCTLPEGHPLLDEIAARYTPESLARFAWSLFRQWLFADGPPKDKWALHAAGKFPDDDTARALGRLARVWAPQGNSSRAQEAVETLALMRSQQGLIEIYEISKKVQSKALRARAETVFETVAGSLNLSPAELADRLVPELSDEDLTFGDARAELDPRLAIRLVGPDGKPAPAPTGDDLARLEQLEKTCKSVAHAQTTRLEQTMADAHRMPYSHFSEIYMMHSLIRHLAGALVWGAYRGDKLVAFALHSIDGAVDVRGEPLELPLDATYGVVHPAELSDADRAAWTKRLPQQPFPQLAREVFAATTAADCQKKLAKLVSRTVPTARLLELQRHGWRRGDSQQGGEYHTIERGGPGWFAEIAFMPGIYLGSPTEQQTQSLEAIALRAEAPPPRAVLSEIQRDLARITAE